MPIEPMSDSELARFLKAEQDRSATARTVFEHHRDEWLRHHSREWVLIKDSDVHGFFSSFEHAFRRGDELYPDEDLYIRQVIPPSDAEPLSLGLLHGVLVVDE